MTSTLTLEPGDKVQTTYGNVIEVLAVCGIMVMGYDGWNGANYHISKIVRNVAANTPLSRSFRI